MDDDDKELEEAGIARSFPRGGYSFWIIPDHFEGAEIRPFNPPVHSVEGFSGVGLIPEQPRTLLATMNWTTGEMCLVDGDRVIVSTHDPRCFVAATKLFSDSPIMYDGWMMTEQLHG